MLEYRIDEEIVRCRTLQATVWDNSQFQENVFLGAVTISMEKFDLTSGQDRWYELKQLDRRLH